MSPEQTELLDCIREVVAIVTKKPIERMALDTELSSLDVDSVCMLEMVGYLEDRLQVALRDEEVARLATVGDVVSLLVAARRSQAGAK